METDAKRTVDQIQAYYESQYGDSAEEQLNTILSSSGYASLDAYREAMVKAYQKSNFLLDYVENNFDEVFDDYYTQSSPREASIIKVAMTDVDNPTEAESTKLNEVAALISSSKSFTILLNSLLNSIIFFLKLIVVLYAFSRKTL